MPNLLPWWKKSLFIGGAAVFAAAAYPVSIYMFRYAAQSAKVPLESVAYPRMPYWYIILVPSVAMLFGFLAGKGWRFLLTRSSAPSPRDSRTVLIGGAALLICLVVGILFRFYPVSHLLHLLLQDISAFSFIKHEPDLPLMMAYGILLPHAIHAILIAGYAFLLNGCGMFPSSIKIQTIAISRANA